MLLCLENRDLACDNCRRIDEYKLNDVTADCITIINAIKEYFENQHTKSGGYHRILWVETVSDHSVSAKCDSALLDVCTP